MTEFAREKVAIMETSIRPLYATQGFIRQPGSPAFARKPPVGLSLYYIDVMVRSRLMAVLCTTAFIYIKKESYKSC